MNLNTFVILLKNHVASKLGMLSTISMLKYKALIVMVQIDVVIANSGFNEVVRECFRSLVARQKNKRLKSNIFKDNSADL